LAGLSFAGRKKTSTGLLPKSLPFRPNFQMKFNPFRKDNYTDVTVPAISTPDRTYDYLAEKESAKTRYNRYEKYLETLRDNGYTFGGMSLYSVHLRKGRPFVY